MATAPAKPIPERSTRGSSPGEPDHRATPRTGKEPPMETKINDAARTTAQASKHEPTLETTGPLTEEQIRDGYVSPIALETEDADCVVIHCSDQRFKRQTEDFVKALGYSQPYVLQIPSGVAVFASLVAAANFLHKGMGLLLKKAIDLTDVHTVICIGHEDCGGYKAGKYEIVQAVTRRLAGKPVREVQHDHLRKAGRTISRQFGGNVEVRVFYADMVEQLEGQRVKFVHVETFGAKRRQAAS
jgi:hypothetical protein